MKLGRNKSRSWHPALVALLIIVPILAFYALVEILRGPPVHVRDRLAEVFSEDSLMEEKTLEIASKFICSCGSCGELPLESCPCHRAAEERQFIRASLQEGLNDSTIILQLIQRFGWLKREYEQVYQPQSAVK
jgi:cytochrome c-type biogenesis protein CcmH/NrfF